MMTGGTGRVPRDRDAAGRPRNARPRDGLGRPLDRTAQGEQTTPEDLRLAPGEALLVAQRLIDDGRPFHAHEVFETEWKSTSLDQRPVWKGLAQIAVGLTHARRGNGRGAVALLRRGAAAVAEHHGEMPAGLDAALAVSAALELADRIERSGVRSLSGDEFRLTLTRDVGAGA